MTRRLRGILPVAALASLPLAGCASPTYPDGGFAFLCSGSPACPQGYTCSSGFCIQEGTPQLFPLVERSIGPIVPEMHVDPDRHGVMSCWTRREDQNSPTGGIDGVFLTGNSVAGTGDVPHVVRLATLDTTGADYLATCAPVPGSGGKVMIAAWTQVGGIAQVRLMIWSPSSTSLVETGSVEPYYVEAGPSTTTLIPHAYRAAVVGDEAWVTVQFPLPSQIMMNTTPFNRVARLRVTAAQLANHPYLPPQRDDISGLTSAFLQDGEFDQRLTPADDGAWLLGGISGLLAYYWIPRDVTGMRPQVSPFTRVGVDESLGLASHGGLLALATAGAVPGGFEPLGSALSYQLGWVSQSPIQRAVGPSLPFNRLDTTSPGAATVGDYLYLFAAPNPVHAAQVAALSMDAGTAEGGTDDAGLDATAPAGDAGSSITAPLNMYRVPWATLSDGGVDAGITPVPDVDAGAPAPEFVRTIPRRQGNFPVTAAAAERIDDHTIGLVWVEFYPTSAAAGGASYAVFIAPISL